MKDALPWVAVGLFLLGGLALAVHFLMPELFSSKTGDPESVPHTIRLYLDEYIPQAPDGVHVADVSVSAKGVARLERWSEPAVENSLRGALAALDTRGELELLAEGPGPGGARAMTAVRVKPGDPRYAWAVAHFLRLRTNLKYKVVPRGPGKGR